MNFQFKSLKSRIAFIFLGLILLIQTIGAIALRESIEKNAQNAIKEQLNLGEKVFLSLLDQDGKNLYQGSQILTSDYGFRSAIASRDDRTIVSALNNYKKRINADIAIFVAKQSSQVVASDGLSKKTKEISIEVQPLIDKFTANPSEQHFGTIGEDTFQLVIAPVKAPVTIGWVVMGFEINNELASTLHSLSHLDVTFIKKSNSNWDLVASTLNDNESNVLLKAMSTDTDKINQSEINILDEIYRTKVVEIYGASNTALYAVLQKNLNVAIAPYKALQLNLWFLSLIGAVMFAVGIIFVSKKISQPLSQLVATAKRLENGDYDVVADDTRKDEIGNLGRAFNNMSQAISSREKSISKLAYFDEVTLLPNRAAFMRDLKVAMKNSEVSKNPISVLLMNLDRFKQVNTVLGQSIGNKVLESIGKRIKKEVNLSSGVVSRVAGDEFAVLMQNTTLEDTIKLANHLSKAFDNPVSIDGSTIDISASIGMASHPNHTTDPELLLAYSELAMQNAKSKNDGAVVFHESMNASSQDNLVLLSDLKTAINDKQFSLFVQPKVNLKTKKVDAVEALIRWKHPERGNIFPDEFIPFAEKTGLIKKISLLMLEKAANLHAELRKQNIIVTVAVNLSTRDLIDQQFPTKLKQIIANYGISRNAISLEITEGSIMSDPKRAQATLSKLSNMGFSLAIDDFGTGYSSLAYLKHLPVNELKIDKSFVTNMNNDNNDAKIVKSTIDLGHNLNLTVVAEGIENDEIWESLDVMGCDYAQGYLMGKPMPTNDFAPWLRAWEKQHTAHSENIKVRKVNNAAAA